MINNIKVKLPLKWNRFINFFSNGNLNHMSVGIEREMVKCMMMICYLCTNKYDSKQHITRENKHMNVQRTIQD